MQSPTKYELGAQPEDRQAPGLQIPDKLFALADERIDQRDGGIRTLLVDNPHQGPLRVHQRKCFEVQMISGLPRQADMIVQDWQVR